MFSWWEEEDAEVEEEGAEDIRKRCAVERFTTECIMSWWEEGASPRRNVSVESRLRSNGFPPQKKNMRRSSQKEDTAEGLETTEEAEVEEWRGEEDIVRVYIRKRGTAAQTVEMEVYEEDEVKGGRPESSKKTIALYTVGVEEACIA